MSELEASRDQRRGFIAALAAFFLWGVLPLYIKLLHGVGTVEIMSHRVVWSCAFVVGWLLLRGELGKVLEALRDRPSLLRLALSATCITANWLVYVSAVNSGHVVETSLGYFINPLVSVMLGVFVLSERLNRLQWFAVAVAACGVAWLTWQVGRPPWIALTLAFTFAFYGLIRKRVQVDAIVGLTVETLLIGPFALAWLLWLAADGTGAMGQQGWSLNLLLILGGPFTAVPLVLFAFGVRRIPLTTVGLLQYLAPTLQLLAGVLLFREPFTPTQAVGFGLIWTALAIYMSDGLWRSRRARAAVIAPAQ